MKKRTFFILIFLIISAIATAACSASSRSPKPVVPLPKSSTNSAPLPPPTPSPTTETPAPSAKSPVSSTATFQIDKLSVEPNSIPAGDKVTISAIISNIGSGQGVYNAELKIDGLVETANQIILESGDSKVIYFDVVRKVPGTYSVAFGDLTAEFVVTQPPQTPVTASTPGADKQAPDFALQTIEGETVTLSDLRGKPVFLNFWASWCGPCRQELPYLQQLFVESLNKDVVILTVNGWEDSSNAKGFLAQNRYTFPVLVDYADGKVAISYGVRVIPTTFLIDRNGMIKAQKIGSFRDKADMVSFIGQ